MTRPASTTDETWARQCSTSHGSGLRHLAAGLGPDLPAREIVGRAWRRSRQGAHVLVLELAGNIQRPRRRTWNFRAIIHDLPGGGRAVWAGGRAGAMSHTAVISPSTEWTFATTTPTNRSSFASADASDRCSDRRLRVEPLATSASAQDTTGVGAISGVVVDAAGLRTKGARVRPRQRVVRRERRPGRLSYRRSACGRLRVEILRWRACRSPDASKCVPGWTAPWRYAAQSGELPADGHRDASVFQEPDEVKNSGFLVEPRRILKGAAALQDVSRTCRLCRACNRQQ